MTAMRTIFASILATAPLVAMSTSATAGGLADPVVVATPEPVTVPVATVSPSGDWTGFYAGGQLGFASLDSDALDDDTSGALLGVHAGYLYDFGRLVVGGEVDYDLTNVESVIPADGVEVDSIARAKMRVGYDAGSWLPYATFGGVQASTSGAVDGDGDGTFAGLGIEYQRGENMRFGWEVLQHQFEDFNDAEGLDIDATTAALRVSFSF